MDKIRFFFFFFFAVMLSSASAKVIKMDETAKENLLLGGVVNLPDSILIQDGSDNLTSLKVTGSTVITGDITVSMKQHKGCLTFFLSSPSKSVKQISAIWSITRSSDCRYLGDHWERSYGDLKWQEANPQRVMPWYFLAYDGNRCQGTGVMTGCRAMCGWQVTFTKTRLSMDVRNGTEGVELGQRRLEMATVVGLDGEAGQKPFDVLRQFCKVMCPHPRLPKQPIYGINDWYFAYGNNSDSLIMQTVRLVHDIVPKGKNRPYCLIDAGWACIAPGKTSANCWSDNFYTPNKNFPDMKALAAQIKGYSMRPGLWMRPLCAAYGAPERLLLPCHNPNEPATDRILDPTVEENRAYFRKCFKAYRDWGYQLVKFDFTAYDILGKWGFQMMDGQDITQGKWSFHRRDLTTAEVILNLYKDLRHEAGSDIALIACNTVSHLAAGLMEAQRIGDDTSGQEWGRTLKMGVNTLAFRGAQHNLFYAADPDCVGLTTAVDWQKNKQWMELVAYSGTPLFVSIQPKAFGPEQKEAVRHCFEIASKPRKVGKSIDWMDTLTPSVWDMEGKIMNFSW